MATDLKTLAIAASNSKNLARVGSDILDIEELEQCAYAIQAFRTEENDDTPCYIVYNEETEEFELGDDASGPEGAWLVHFDFEAGMVALFNLKAEKFIEL